MKLKYLLLAAGVTAVGVCWSQVDPPSFKSFWWIVAIGGFALSAAFVVIDGKSEA